MQRTTQAAIQAAFFGAALGLGGGIAQAKTITQVHSFDFQLEETPATNPEELEFRGSENLTFDRFDVSDGRTLNSVTLEVDTTVAGVLNLFEEPPPEPDILKADAGQDENDGEEPVELNFESFAEVGVFEFVAEADFDDFEFGEDGDFINEGQIEIDKSGQGSRSTEEVNNFLGTETLNGDVGARMFVEYAPNTTGASQEGIQANGQARLIYDFDELDVTPPPSTTIPTPSAAAAGLALLGLAALRRRKR